MANRKHAFEPQPFSDTARPWAPTPRYRAPRSARALVKAGPGVVVEEAGQAHAQPLAQHHADEVGQPTLRSRTLRRVSPQNEVVSQN